MLEGVKILSFSFFSLYFSEVSMEVNHRFYLICSLVIHQLCIRHIFIWVSFHILILTQLEGYGQWQG